eukprot:COSAG05_NODE_681_length_7961_cov_105.324854_2_plen_57_part_00
MYFGFAASTYFVWWFRDDSGFDATSLKMKEMIRQSTAETQPLMTVLKGTVARILNV